MANRKGKLPAVRIRPAEESDCMDIFRWRNDPETRNNSVLSTDRVPLDTHKRWFAEKLRSSSSMIWIGVQGGKKVGLMRFDVEPKRVVVTVNVNPKYRGRGIGTKLVGMTTGRIFRLFGKPILAKIKSRNLASIRVFGINGYMVSRKTGEVIYMRYDRSRVKGGGRSTEYA